MGWRTRAKKSAEGNWLRWKDGDKREVYFCADPKETKGKWQDGSPKHSFDFTVIADGEMKTWGASSKSEKLALADEDEMEPIVGNNYLVSRSGQGANTVFRFRKMSPSPEQHDAILQWREDNGLGSPQPQTRVDEEPPRRRRRVEPEDEDPVERAERPRKAQPHDLDEDTEEPEEEAPDKPQDEPEEDIPQIPKPHETKRIRVIYDGTPKDKEAFEEAVTGKPKRRQPKKVEE